MKFTPKQQIGSQTAKGGFTNETDIVKKFNQFRTDHEAQLWLSIMGYDIDQITQVTAVQIPTRLNPKKVEDFGIPSDQFACTQKFKKADIQVTIVIGHTIYRENISLKKANKTANFNQIDKRSVDTYQNMWHFDNEIAQTLKKFTGEIQPNPNEVEKHQLRDERRWYLNELPENQSHNLLTFFEKNKILVFNDILKGRGALAADWFLVTKLNRDQSTTWILKSINDVVHFFAEGDIYVSKKGGLILGKLTAQRKGGTPDPKSLQFKIKPLDLF